MTVTESLRAQCAEILERGQPRFEVVSNFHVVDVLETWTEAKRRAWAFAWSHVGEDVSAVECRVLDGQKVVLHRVGYKVQFVAKLGRNCAEISHA